MTTERQDLQGMVCAVTGSGGYVGTSLVRRLRADGATVIELRTGPEPGQAGQRRFNLREQPGADLFRGVGLLIHCAYDFRAKGWEEIRSANVEGTRRLFGAAARAGVGRFLLISSISAFPGCQSLYGRAKLETEAIASGFGAVVLRPGLVFGPRPGGMLGSLNRMASLPVLIPLLGSGGAVQYVAHEDDLGALVSLAARSPGEVGTAPIVAAHSRGYTLREIMTALARARGRSPRFLPIPIGLVSAGLSLLEAAGLRLRIRRDNLVSLLHQNPSPDFSGLQRLGQSFRPFSPP